MRTARQWIEDHGGTWITDVNFLTDAMVEGIQMRSQTTNETALERYRRMVEEWKRKSGLK